jgi:glycosyltransferase involved in cell wall biosynthesis
MLHRHFHIVHLVSSLQVGGMEQFVLRIAEEQRQQGHTVTVLALHDGPLRAKEIGVPVIVLRDARRIGRGFQAALTMRRLHPHIAHAHNRSSLKYALLGKWLAGARVVMTRHGQDPRYSPTRREWRQTDAVVAVSEAAAKVLRSDSPAYSDKVRVILNGVAFQPPQRRREEVRAELGLSEEPVGIIVARIDHQKGHDCLLEAAARLAKSGLCVTLLIVGDGTARPEMESLAGKLGLRPEQIRFLGFRSDIPDLLAASDFFVLPSLNEGLPLSVLEAMAQGLPVVATPVGGIPEIILSNQHGLLVPVNDPSALAAALRTLVCDADLRHRLGGCGQERVREHFSFQKMAREYEALYANLWHPCQ